MTSLWAYEELIFITGTSMGDGYTKPPISCVTKLKFNLGNIKSEGADEGW